MTLSQRKNFSQPEEIAQAPPTKKSKDPVKARAAKQANDDARAAEKERKKAEARFDKLLMLFEKVRVEAPEQPPPPPPPMPESVPVKRKRAPSKPKAVTTVLQTEEYEEPDLPVLKARRPAAVVHAVTPNNFNLRFL